MMQKVDLMMQKVDLMLQKVKYQNYMTDTITQILNLKNMKMRISILKDIYLKAIQTIRLFLSLHP